MKSNIRRRGVGFILLITGLSILFSTLFSTLPLGATPSQNPPQASPQNSPKNIVSLDYCADQFVLQFIARENIKALSSYATKSFSYLRAQAVGLAQTLPHSERVLALRPELVVRSYGGGPKAAGFYKAAGVRVVNLPYVARVQDIPDATRHIARQLGDAAHGEKLAREFEALLARTKRTKNQTALYITRGGVTAGRGTLMDDVIKLAGYRNFETRHGWQNLPLERLAGEQPDRIIFATFGRADDENRDLWTAARHPLVTTMLDERVIKISGALTSCTAWFLMDAIKQLRQADTRGVDMQAGIE